MRSAHDPDISPLHEHGAAALVVGAAAETRRPAAVMLTEAGYRVREATSPHEALELQRTLRPHIVIIDVALGADDGIALCRTLRARGDGGNPFVMLVLEPGTESRLFDAFLAGADDHVVKPVEPTALLPRVEEGVRLVRAWERQVG